MTEITGTAFLSYNHEQSEVATILQESLEDHGIPVWRDIFNLRPEPLRDELIDEIMRSDKACGIALISEEVADSEIILEDELPAFRRRWNADDEFYIVIVPHPDLGVSGAKSALDEVSGPADLQSWKMVPLETTSIGAARSISKTVLQERLRQANKKLFQEPV